MGEYAPKAILAIFTRVRAVLPNALLSGVIGNSSHTFGYHRSRNRLKTMGRPNDYSIREAIDKLGDGDACAALDLGGTQLVTQLLTRRLLNACVNRDPRIVGVLREFGGSLDGKFVTARRIGDNALISFDRSHLTHVHMSIHRRWVNDAEKLQLVADVLCGLPLAPVVWDGRSFPGAQAFIVGQSHAAVTTLGERLIVWGFDKHHDDDGYQAGPMFTEFDEANVRDFQLAQGWRDVNADGIPGPVTWNLLMSDPAPQPTPEPPTMTKIKVLQLNLLNDGAFSKRARRLAQMIKTTNTSVLLLEEAPAMSCALLQEHLGADWVWSRVSNRAVFCDKTIWRMGEERQRGLPTPSTGVDKTFPLVELQHIKGGDVVWFAAVHLSSTSAYPWIKFEDMQRERELQAKALVNVLKPYRWAVVGADCNSSSPNPGRPKAIFRNAGYQLLSDTPGVQDTDIPSLVNGTGWIDELFALRGLKITGGRLIETNGLSDHNGLLGELDIMPR